MVGQCSSAKRCPARDRTTRNSLSCSTKCLRLDLQACPTTSAVARLPATAAFASRLAALAAASAFRPAPTLACSRDADAVSQSLRSHAPFGEQVIACRMSHTMLLTIALKVCNPRISVTRVLIKPHPLLGDDFQRGGNATCRAMLAIGGTTNDDPRSDEHLSRDSHDVDPCEVPPFFLLVTNFKQVTSA